MPRGAQPPLPIFYRDAGYVSSDAARHVATNAPWLLAPCICSSPNPATQTARTANESPGSSQWLQIHNPHSRLEILNTCAVPTPYQPETCVASCSDFALRRNPRMQRRWYGDGTAQIRGWYTHGGRWAGGIFALRRPRPYSRHCGEGNAAHAAPTTICAQAGINGNGGRSQRGIG